MYKCTINFTKKISCKECSAIKNKGIFYEKYNVDNPNKLDYIKERKKKTCMERYNVEHPSQNEDIKQKIINTNRKKYKTDYGIQNEDVKNKIYKTNIERYGVKHVFQNKEIHMKAIQTHKERYGFEFSFQDKNIIKKARQSLYKNGTAPCSSQQKHLHNLLGGVLNYPVDRCMLDIAFLDEMIYIEYDGGGHDLSVKLGQITQAEFNRKQISRDKFLKSLGWKIIRIISTKDKLIPDIDILNIVEFSKYYLNNLDNNWIILDMDNLIFKSKKLSISYDEIKKEKSKSRLKKKK